MGSEEDESRKVKTKCRLEDLKLELGSQLLDARQLKRSEGIPTGFQPLDQFLLWNGFPKGALSLLTGDLGMGATSLWVEAAARVTRQSRWVAWVDREAQLFPVSLWQRELDLSRLVTIEAPEAEKKFFWLLQELMASTLFDLIGCDLGQMQLRNHQLRKLQMLARSYQTTLVFFTARERSWDKSLFSLIANFRNHEICIERALHRPTPYRIPRRNTYGSFSLTIGDRIISGFNSAAVQGLEPGSLLNPANHLPERSLASGSSPAKKDGC